MVNPIERQEYRAAAGESGLSGLIWLIENPGARRLYTSRRSVLDMTFNDQEKIV